MNLRVDLRAESHNIPLFFSRKGQASVWSSGNTILKKRKEAALFHLHPEKKKEEMPQRGGRLGPRGVQFNGITLRIFFLGFEVFPTSNSDVELPFGTDGLPSCSVQL